MNQQVINNAVASSSGIRNRRVPLTKAPTSSAAAEIPRTIGKCKILMLLTISSGLPNTANVNSHKKKKARFPPLLVETAIGRAFSTAKPGRVVKSTLCCKAFTIRSAKSPTHLVSGIIPVVVIFNGILHNRKQMLGSILWNCQAWPYLTNANMSPSQPPLRWAAQPC